MTLLDLNRIRRPWAAPAVAVLGVAAFAVAPHLLAGNPHPTLPSRTPTQLVAAVDSTSVHALHGTIASTPHLGLPQLPGSDGGNQLSTLLTEPSTWTLALDGAGKQRVSLLGTGEETDVIRNGSSVWTWDSSSQSATHYRLPARHGADTAAHPPARSGPSADSLSPVALATKIVSAIRPSTRLSVGPTAVVAGRSAYTLVAAPRQTGSLVGRAVIDIDSATGLPLGVSIYPTGSNEAAISEQFTSLSLGAPAASTFDFTPPPGASVNTHGATPGTAGHRAPSHAGVGHHTARAPQHAPAAQPHVVGSGWSAVGVYPSAGGAGIASMLGGVGPAGGPQASSSQLLDALTTAGPDGSKLLQTRLLTVLVTRTGTVLAGAVPAGRLEALARSGA